MADVSFSILGGLSKRLRDMGDGTHAEVVSLGAAPGQEIGKVDHTTTGIGHGVKTVASAGTDEALVASATPAKWVTIQARTDNTGNIAIGGAGVDANEATGTGVLLAAAASITLPVDDLADVFVDATVSGDGVRFIYGS